MINFLSNTTLYLINKIFPEFAFDKRLNEYEIVFFLIKKIKMMIKGMLISIFIFHRLKILFIGKNFSVEFAGRISLGNKVRIGSFVHLSGLGEQGLKIGDNVSIGDFTKIEVSQTIGNIGKGIIIGKNVGIGAYSAIGGAGGLNIGKDTIIGQYFSTHPENHIFNNREIEVRHQGVTRWGIEIGQNCWIGAKVTILDGAKIGDNCIIAAGSVVRGNIMAGSLIAGIPAKVIRRL